MTKSKEAWGKVGVFLCECGPNIKDAVDLPDLEKFSKNLENVELVKTFGLLCSQKGKDLIAEEIENHELTRIVVAACSPKEHEETFKSVLKDAGLNPFLLQIANIREHCAWVIKDKKLATEHAKKAVAAAVKRVLHHHPLETTKIDVVPDVLVIGSGIAGISSALTLSQKNRKVYLVDKLPYVGGKATRLGEVFPEMKCASCMMEPKIDAVLHNENIKIHTYSEITEILGFYGNYSVKLKSKAKFIDMPKCVGCGVCLSVCPVKVKNEYNFNMEERGAIFTPYQGAMPSSYLIDKENCLRFKGQECDACSKACPTKAVNFEEKDEEIELNVGSIVLATGYDTYDVSKIPNFGYGAIENVYTSLEVENLLNKSGPTSGKLLLKNGKPPENIAIIHCVGSRNKDYLEYCSGICCQNSLKFIDLIHKQLPTCSILDVYADYCLPGKGAQGLYNKVAEEVSSRVRFLRTKDMDSVKVEKLSDKISIVGKVDNLGIHDMVILMPGMEGAKDSEKLSELLNIKIGKNKFYVEENPKLEPVSSISEGIYIAGCAQGPNDISVSSAQGQAAAGKVLSKLIPGAKIELDPRIAEVHEDHCSGCKACIAVCPYKAISYDSEKKQAKVTEALCRGCGVCVATCPSSAIVGKHFTDLQISEEISALLK